MKNVYLFSKVLLFLLFGLSARAQDSMYVHKKSGEIVRFAISELDSITFAPPSHNENPTDLACLRKNPIIIDASTAGYSKRYTCSANISQLTDTLILDIKALADMDFLYVTKALDNGNPIPITFGNTLVSEQGIMFSQQAVGTPYEIATPTSIVNAFRIKIPIPLRTSLAAESDVYTLWLTSGQGSFDGTGKRTVVGPIQVVLLYKSTSPYFTATNIALGDQYNSIPSFLTTIGSIKAATPLALIETNMTSQQKSSTLNSFDISLGCLNASGTAYSTNSGLPYLYGMGIRASLGFTANIEGTNITKFALYTGIAFESATGSDLSNLTNPSTDRIKIEAGNTYVFLTADGRRGLIKIHNLSSSGGTSYQATVSVKVLTY